MFRLVVLLRCGLQVGLTAPMYNSDLNACINNIRTVISVHVIQYCNILYMYCNVLYMYCNVLYMYCNILYMYCNILYMYCNILYM